MINSLELAQRLRNAFQIPLPGDAGLFAHRDLPLDLGYGYSSDIADYYHGGRETQPKL